MKRISVPEFEGSAVFMGRSWTDTERTAVWFNWSASGFRVRFHGTTLKARFVVREEKFTAPFQQEIVMLAPVVGVRADGAQALSQRVKLAAPEQWLTLFDGEEGEHTAEVLKLSENVMGKCGLAELETDGEFLAPCAEKRALLEVVGDSITCGYGNEAKKPGFRTEDENALAAYGFLAAQELGMEYSSVCVSGCAVADSDWIPGMENRGMLSMYAFTDAPMDRALKNAELQPWDFAAHPAKVTVINLGTNDANEIKFKNFAPEAVESFRTNYKRLLRLIREKNGPETKILCTLGSMDYYLWDDIRDIAAEYRAESGDTEVYCRKFGAINLFGEGTGADTHPSAKTHARMGRELAAAVREIC